VSRCNGPAAPPHTWTQARSGHPSGPDPKTSTPTHILDEPEIRVNLEWRISPDIRVILGYDKFGVNAQGEEPWEWSVKIAKPCYSDTNPGVVQSIEVLGDNIDDIMDKVPLLGLGIDPCRIRTFAHREELKQLFLSKHELERLK
jgi:hypothetical protein